jgi:hypothetical protein
MIQLRAHAIVSAAEAELVPYPYVYVNDDGTVRELHADERQYLEKPFPPTDGGRPHVKSAFTARDGWGSIQGFCRRSKVPRNLTVAPAPANDPNPPMGKADYIAWLKERAKVKGIEVIEEPDGTVKVKRTSQTQVSKKSFWLRLLTSRWR